MTTYRSRTAESLNRDPEPWRIVLDAPANPILVEFRRSFTEAKELPVTAWPNAKPEGVLARWLRWVDDPNASSEDPESWTHEQRDHARRVLTLLASFTKED